MPMHWQWRAPDYTPPASPRMSKPEHLKRFFTAEGNGFRIIKDIRQGVAFALHDVLKDPPFTKLDLLSCRNLLIYLDADAQRKLLPLSISPSNQAAFYCWARPESIDQHADLFTAIGKKSKSFKRRPNAVAAALVQFPSARPLLKRDNLMSLSPNPPAKKPQLSAVTEKLLARIANSAPPCVFIDTSDEIFFAHGKTGKDLEIAQGHAHFNVLEMARAGNPPSIGDRDPQSQSASQAACRWRGPAPGQRRQQEIALTVAPVAEIGEQWRAADGDLRRHRCQAS